jgi:DNA polymerase III subunit beta
MDIRAQREDLLAELGLLQGIVERRTTIPILSHVLLRAADSKLHLAATDLDVSLATHCPADVAGEGALAVQARKLTEIVRSLGPEEIHFLLEDGSLNIRAGRSHFKIRGLDPQSFPTLPTVDSEVGLEVALPVFKRMIAKVIFAISTEESRFQLNGALLRLKAEGVELVATDGHRLALVEAPASADGNGALEVKAPQEGVLVPRKALQELQRFDGEGTVTYRRGEHHLSFRLGNRELVCRILEGTFPDYERVIAKNHDKKPILEKQLFQEAVQRVSLLTSERSRGVLLQFAPEQLVISAANPDLGEATEQLACEYEGDEIRLGLNPDYLGSFLAAVESPRVRLEVKDHESQCVAYPADGEGLRHLCVIMPMHV